MKKRSKSKSVIPRIDPYLEGLTAKLLDRLVSLEKKMDKVLAQTAGRPSAGGDPPKLQQVPRRDRQLYEAICADCHKVCEVPFRPTEVRPVYCKECWGKRKAGGSGPRFPVLTPVALPPKPVGKLHLAQPIPVKTAAKRSKKRPAAKKSKKKK